jgi:hypothetical protein
MPDQNPVQSAVFGQYGNENARDYFGRNGQPLTDKGSAAVLDESSPVEREKQYNFYTSTQGLTSGRNNASHQITDLVKQGKVNQATRKAYEWNATVDEQMQEFFDTYGDDPDLKKALSAYKLSVSPARIKARGK